MSLLETDIFGTVNDKVKMAINRIKAFEPPEGYYVAFSGGKDSVVILDLVKKSGVKFDAHYNITGIDPPELYYFIRDQHPEVQRHRPEMTMWALIVKKGFPPTRSIRYCCQFLKEDGGHERKVITGVRWKESQRRNKRQMVETCFRDGTKTYLHPIIDWSEMDVWEYIHENNLPYCKLYDEGFKRLGCVMCPMSSRQGREGNRWPRIRAAYIRAFDRAIQKSKERGIIPAQQNGEEMFRWWLRENPKKEDPDQTVMFE